MRAWATPAGAPLADGGTPALPAGDDLLPALTDAAFALLVARLEQALTGVSGAVRLSLEPPATG